RTGLGPRREIPRWPSQRSSDVPYGLPGDHDHDAARTRAARAAVADGVRTAAPAPAAAAVITARAPGAGDAAVVPHAAAATRAGSGVVRGEAAPGPAGIARADTGRPADERLIEPIR